MIFLGPNSLSLALNYGSIIRTTIASITSDSNTKIAKNISMTIDLLVNHNYLSFMRARSTFGLSGSAGLFYPLRLC